MLQLIPDYSEVGTAEELMLEFEDLGAIAPGWYLTDTDSILIQVRKEDDDTRWHAKQPEGSVFVVHVWNCPINGTVFGVTIPPVRMDARD